MTSDSTDFDYDVALSFAGEDRAYVEAVADAARDLGVRVFYDLYEEVGLWGKDLYEHLDWVYRKAARFCVLFASSSYAEKVWTTHERCSAQARALEENVEYILPARFDDTEIPGLRPTVGHVDLRQRDPDEVAKLIRAKVGPPSVGDFLPPRLDVLYEELDIADEQEQETTSERAALLFRVLGRMTEEERHVLATIFIFGCVHELPDNMHIEVDILRRELGRPVQEVLEIVGGLRSLGVNAWLREGEADENLGKPDDTLVVEVEIRRVDEVGGNVTELLRQMIRANGMCVHHATEALVTRDFAHLSSVTVRPETVH